MHEVIKLWVAEGFIKANRGQSLEEVAECYFNELVDRNILLLRSGAARWTSCSIHDFLRDLCINLSEKENFYCEQRSLDKNLHFIVDKKPRAFTLYSHVSEMPSIVHSVIVPGERAAPSKTRLLRVFCCDIQSQHYDALREVSMRFLQHHSSKVKYDYLLHSLISRIWSLQTLIVRTREELIAPTEIWKMPQLRHIDISTLYLSDPPPPVSDDDVCVLQNLQTLRRVKNLTFSEEVCKRVPNIKDLHLRYEFNSESEACPCYHLENVGCFNKLELLEYICYVPEYAGDSLQNIKFPSSLKELILYGCKLEWSYMAVIASLPHLESLNLDENAIAGTEWIFVDEKFVSLKYMRITQFGHMTKWIADSSNFPVLEKLYIWDLWELDEIPSGIGEIPTLQLIHMVQCSESANISAVEILHEQPWFGNLGLQVGISTKEAESLREKLQQLGFTCQNLVINNEPYLINPS